MKKVGWFSRLSNQQITTARMQRIAGGFAAAMFLLMTGIAAAQIPTPSEPMAVPEGYTSHQTVDIGGHIADIKGSGAMYDTLVNQQSGPRILGATFELRALPANKHPQVDLLHAVANGFGGDPYNFAKLDFSKGKLYEFSGVFRRDRQYSDYDLLGNPNINTNQSIPIGPTTAPTGSLAWPQLNHSTVMFNTVRRMTDTNLTLYPLATVTFRAGYSQNVFQGPGMSPSYTIAKYNALLEQYQRNSTDEFTMGVDWKPYQHTKFSFDEVITHFKTGSYFTLNPNGFLVQEADGTPVDLGNFDSQTAYGIAGCNTTSMGTAPYTILSPAQTAGGLPIINPACDVVTSYTRTQPTRILTPTETFRFQSSSIKNITMNGNLSYTKADMNLPNYYENFQGLDGAARSITYNANASAKRQVVSGDYGVVWQATKKVSLSEQFNYSDVHQPGTAVFTNKTTLSTPAAPNQTITYSGALTTTVAATGASSITGAAAINTPMPAYFGQRFFTNNLTGTWDASSRATLSLTYRYRTHRIGEGLNGVADNAPLAAGADNNGTVTINENGGIFNAALRPAKNWDLNGTAEVLYDDNAFTPVGPRQTRHYRVHTLYKPKPWATFSGAFNDLERHNNTNQNAATASTYYGPLNHVDYSRVYSLGAVISPNEHYGLDFNYAYSDVYAATNICFLSGAAATLPGAAPAPGSVPASATQTGNVYANGVCNYNTAHSGAPVLGEWYGRDFMDAPTQFVSAALRYSPVDKIHSGIGYRISDVNGTRFFNDARDVNGSLVSKYQTPFVNLAWTVHAGLIFKAEYNYYGYGEGGPSGSLYCSTSTSTSAVPVLCSSLAPTYLTGVTEPTSGLTAPRTFHANNVTFSLHYAF
ncbi:MAG: hypothetical protein ABSC77_01810 [Terracidiphilus sp.]|jgi:hypothetical protein